MIAKDIMIQNVYYVTETDTIRTVIQKFINHGISGVPIIGNHGELIAYISDGDIMRYIGKHKDIIVDSLYMVNVVEANAGGLLERAEQILNLPVLDIAKKKVIHIPWDEKIDNVATLLGKKKIKKLPVVKDGKLAGIISRGDVIRHAFKKFL